MSTPTEWWWAVGWAACQLAPVCTLPMGAGGADAAQSAVTHPLPRACFRARLLRQWQRRSRGCDGGDNRGGDGWVRQRHRQPQHHHQSVHMPMDSRTVLRESRCTPSPRPRVCAARASSPHEPFRPLPGPSAQPHAAPLSGCAGTRTWLYRTTRHAGRCAACSHRHAPHCHPLPYAAARTPPVAVQEEEACGPSGWAPHGPPRAPVQLCSGERRSAALTVGARAVVAPSPPALKPCWLGLRAARSQPTGR